MLCLQGCVLGGFLSYKLALLLKIASDNSPKVCAVKLIMCPRPYPKTNRVAHQGSECLPASLQGYKSDEMSRPIIEK
jgi:hypothetical protein